MEEEDIEFEKELDQAEIQQMMMDTLPLEPDEPGEPMPTAEELETERRARQEAADRRARSPRKSKSYLHQTNRAFQ